MSRKYKIGSFIPYKKDSTIDKELKLDIEVLKSLRHKFNEDKELVSLFSNIIRLLINKLRS